TTSTSPKAVLLTAVRLSEAQSFRAQFNIVGTFSAGGPKASQLGAVSGQTFTFSGSANFKDPKNFTGTFTAFAGLNIEIQIVSFGGKLYISNDSGTTFRSLAIG